MEHEYHRIITEEARDPTEDHINIFVFTCERCGTKVEYRYIGPLLTIKDDFDELDISIPTTNFSMTTATILDVTKHFSMYCPSCGQVLETFVINTYTPESWLSHG